MTREIRAETAALALQNSQEMMLEPCKPKSRFNCINTKRKSRICGGLYATCSILAESRRKGDTVYARNMPVAAESGQQEQRQRRAAAHLRTPGNTVKTGRLPRCSDHVTTVRRRRACVVRKG